MLLLFGDREVLGLPSLSAVEGPPHKNSVACGTLRPVVKTSQLVERDVTNERMAQIIERHRHVARDAIVLGVDILRRFQVCPASVEYEACTLS